MTNKKNIKKRINNNKKSTSEKILFIIFSLLLILVIILGIVAINKKSTTKETVKSNIIIPIIEKNSKNELSVDISEMQKGQQKEYFFKVTNVQDKNINKENIGYSIKFTKPSSATLELYKNDSDKNLLSDQENLVLSNNMLAKNKEQIDIYKLVIKNDKNTTDTTALVTMQIES